MSLAFQSIAPGNSFEFDPDSVLDGDHGSRLEFKCREGRACLVNRQRIVAVHQHVPTPLADSHYEELDLESRGRLPLTEHLKYPLLGILVLRRRTLRAFEPADHVLRRYPPNCVGPRNDCCLDGLTFATEPRRFSISRAVGSSCWLDRVAFSPDVSTPGIRTCIPLPSTGMSTKLVVRQKQRYTDRESRCAAEELLARSARQNQQRYGNRQERHQP